MENGQERLAASQRHPAVRRLSQTFSYAFGRRGFFRRRFD